MKKREKIYISPTYTATPCLFVFYCHLSPMLERDLERRLKAMVKLAGGCAYKLDARAQKGAPDRVVVLPGRGTFLVELKTDTGRLSPLQQVEIERIRNAGGDVQVIYGMKQLENFVDALA